MKLGGDRRQAAQVVMPFSGDRPVISFSRQWWRLYPPPLPVLFVQSLGLPMRTWIERSGAARNGGALCRFVTQTDVYMCMKHLMNLLQEGSWGDAIDYLSRFLPSDRRLGIYGRALFHFLRVHKAIDDVVAGAPEARSVTAALEQCIIRHPTKSHAITRLRAIFSSLLCSKKLRAVLNLKRVRLEASLTVIDLIYKTPELKDYMSHVRGPMEPQKVLPMGFGHASFRPRRHVKKRRCLSPASVVAGLYLQKKKMLPSSASSDHSHGLSRETLIKAKEWLVDLVDACLEAGKQSDEDLPQFARTKSAPVTPVSQANITTFKRPVSDTELVRKAEEWAIYLIDERLVFWPDMSQDYPPPFPCKDGHSFTHHHSSYR